MFLKRKCRKLLNEIFKLLQQANIRLCIGFNSLVWLHPRQSGPFCLWMRGCTISTSQGVAMGDGVYVAGPCVHTHKHSKICNSEVTFMKS